jgi:hypothetical protein
MLGGRKNLTEPEKKRIWCNAARIEGHSDYVDTTFGPMPAKAAGCAWWQLEGSA